MIRRVAVAFEENRIFDLVTIDGNGASKLIVERKASRRHAETNNVFFTLVDALGGFGGREMATRTTGRMGG